MKYTILALVAASIAVGFSSCAGICPRPAPTKTQPAPCAGKASTAQAGTCSDPMGPGCRGNCSGQDCTCRKYPCKCAPKVKPKPKPTPKVVVVKPAPPPPVKVVASPPPPPITVSEGWQRYKWEFANPPNGVHVAPDQPLPPGVYPNPAQDGFWMKGSYSERQIPSPR